MTARYLSFPYLGLNEAGETTREWAHMTFTTSDGKAICNRAIKRIVRKWIKLNLGRTVRTSELRNILKRCN